MAEEDKCITLLCSLLDSWDNLIVAIGSSIQATLKFDEIVSSLLSEEMRRKTMDNHSMDALSVRGRPQERNKNKGSGGRSKSPGKGIRKCWKCGKAGHYKKDCRSKNVEKAKGYEDTPSTEVKNSVEEGGEVYLYFKGNPLERDTWLIDLGASCHMTPHRE